MSTRRRAVARAVKAEHIKTEDAVNDDAGEKDSDDVQNSIIEEAKPSFLTRLSFRLSFMKYVIFVLFLPPFLNYAALQREADVLHPAGEMVDIGWGQKMFIRCIGEGLPTVILDAPTGMTSDVWILIQQQLSDLTKVCVYDRAGLGFSNLPFSDIKGDEFKDQKRRFVAQPFTVEQMVSDLYHLINNVKSLPRPFILVGSEISTLISRSYAALFPREVTDVILIDPFVENLSEDRMWNEYWQSHLLPSFQSLHLSALLGLSRIALMIGWLQPAFMGSEVQPEVVLRQKYLLCNPSHMSTVLKEYLYTNVSFAQISDIPEVNSFPQNISVSVIHSKWESKLPEEVKEVWHAAQQYLLETLHPGSTRIVSDDDHMTLYYKPEIIVNLVYKLVNKWRQKENMQAMYKD